MQLRENVPLQDLTTFHIGGPAAFFAEGTTLAELQEAFEFAKQKNIPILILGGGSNILARDEGFNGLVIHITIRGIEYTGETVIAGAGESWDTLVADTVAHGLWGLENLSGVPGSVGGAVVGGIGAYGASVGQHVAWVEAYNVNSGGTERFTSAECQFGYRTSLFKHRPDLVVLRAAFNLSKEPTPDVSYKDLAARFSDSSLDLPTIRAAVLSIRDGKFPDITKEGTAGSFFKNPIVDEAQAAALRASYPELPLFTMPEVAGYKVPLAWLLDRVLNLKGHVHGTARLFERQPLVIAATRGAVASDARALADEVKKAVKEKFSLDIEEEVVVL